MPIAYEVFEGNRSDVTTVEDIVTMMEDKYGRARMALALFNQIFAIFLIAEILTNSATALQCSGIRENSVARSSTEHTA